MRVIKRKYKILAACICTCLIFVSVLGVCRTARAAEHVDLTRTGNLVLTLGMEDSAQMAQDLARIKEPLNVHVWKLGRMLETGKYEFQGVFRELSLEGEDWKTLSEKAFALIYDLDEKGMPLGEAKVSPDRTGTIAVTENGAVTGAEELTDLELGLYLVALDTTRSPRYEYSFAPVVVSLPWSEYQYIGGDAPDIWQYEREAVLKPARTQRYGDVRILKTLNSYNVSQGEVTFVFEVTAVDPESGATVYSNVVSATFSAVGTQEIRIEHIPAEAVVTVTEVYSGANCQITASDEEPQAVIAEELDGSADPITFRFTNTYNEEAKNGYGVENRFRYDTEAETYVWTTNRDSMRTEVQP